MSGGAAVQGTVTDGDDDPVEGATVLVVPRSDNATSVGGSAQTTVTGAYIVAGLPVGTYDVARKSVVSGQSVSVRVDLGGLRIIQTKHNHTTTHSSPIPHNTQNNNY